MSNPHIDLALSLLRHRLKDKQFRARLIAQIIEKDGGARRKMADDRMLREHQVEADRELAETLAAITHLESLQ